MAFFKFRFPGQQPAVSTDHGDAAASSLEGVRRQARYRLVGAAVLVLVAVLGFPLIFDTQPRPVAVDTPIIVPDRQTAPPLVTGVLPPAQMPAAPLKPANPEQASQVAAEPVADAPAPKPPATVAQPPQASVPVETAAPAQAAQAQARVQQPAAAVPTKPPAAASPPANPPAAASKPMPTPAPLASRDDAARARALLNGAPANTGERHVLQVGAYTDVDKVREVRRKLEQAGLKTYTQAVEGQDGKRVVRVRIGPFDSKAEADKAAAQVRKLNLPVSVLRL